MKKLFLLCLFLLLPVLCFSQSQVFPAQSGWTLIYDDTLGRGKKDATYSYVGSGTMAFSDTVAMVNAKQIWGASTLALNLDLQNTSKT